MYLSGRCRAVGALAAVAEALPVVRASARAPVGTRRFGAISRRGRARGAGSRRPSTSADDARPRGGACIRN
ncbi:hypothetical protein BLAT2472_20799 [Burkholderia latens]